MSTKDIKSGFSAVGWPLRLAIILLVSDIAIVLASLILTLSMQDVPSEGFRYSIFRFFYIDMEGNLPSWQSSTKFFVLAVLFGLLGWKHLIQKSPISWAICFMAGIFLVFSLDEAAEIHERVGGLTDFLLPDGDGSSTPFGVTGVWIFLLGLPVACLLFYLAAKLRPLFSGRSKSAKKYVLGMALFLGGALGFELLINFVPESSVPYILIMHAEELLEMVGVTVIIWATVELLQSYRFKILLDPVVAAADGPEPAFSRSSSID